MVENIKEATEFYTKHLMFALKEDWGPVTVLCKGDLELWISSPDSSAGKTAINGRHATPGGSNRFVLVVRDLPTMLNKFETTGVRIGCDLVRGPAGSWALILDPAGNPIELFEPKGK